MKQPLADQLRPTTLKEVIGQEHLIGEGKVLTNLVLQKRLFSMILYGRPGLGKTSIAYALCLELNCKYQTLNAVINNKKDFDIAFETAKIYQGLVLIIDEFHRLNKDRQDLLLPHLESGLITIIGLTTHNPYHRLNPALRSRCHLFELKDLSLKHLKEGLNRALERNLLSAIKIKDSGI